ncbi:MAG TPA: 3-dehydroquinate synthase [Candidatus Ruania gallistercoris]|uniref:3-dehydroquinate synthase n=1 Tax=Candidatus Ruania gallistercoris TaxID=2838746 RepID=A0A9D2EIM9_9MICO|nr:3-dehydroquinate synthase [Candidatus Ruania gallistercoris]
MSDPLLVPVRAEHEYEVLIGRGVRSRLPTVLPAHVRVFLLHPPALSDAVDTLASTLSEAGHQVLRHCTPDGEAAKTAQVAAECWAALGQASFTRDDVVIGIGGGATTDLAGFVAASWLRGVQVIHLPTTLLGMVDAAVGGKTGINTGEGKNLVGAFHSPVAVLCDLDWLRMLPPADLRAGMAEIVKCGFIADPVILDLVEADPEAATDPAGEVVGELVRRAVAVKADVVSTDLKETGRREILNYGHTLGHAIEHREQFRWRHGDAVAVGMVFAAELAARAGLLAPEVVTRHREILTRLTLPTSYRGDVWPQLREAMGRDKKARGSVLHFVVLTDVGSPTRLTDPDPAWLQAAYAAISEERR